MASALRSQVPSAGSARNSAGAPVCVSWCAWLHRRRGRGLARLEWVERPARDVQWTQLEHLPPPIRAHESTAFIVADPRGWDGMPAPQSAEPGGPFYWLLSLIMCDALGWEQLHLHALHERPHTLIDDDREITYDRVVGAVREAMFTARAGPTWWLAHMDGVRHWPDQLVDVLFQHADDCYVGEHGPWSFDGISLRQIIEEHAGRATTLTVVADARRLIRVRRSSPPPTPALDALARRTRIAAFSPEPVQALATTGCFGLGLAAATTADDAGRPALDVGADAAAPVDGAGRPALLSSAGAGSAVAQADSVGLSSERMGRHSMRLRSHGPAPLLVERRSTDVVEVGGDVIERSRAWIAGARGCVSASPTRRLPPVGVTTDAITSSTSSVLTSRALSTCRGRPAPSAGGL